MQLYHPHPAGIPCGVCLNDGGQLISVSKTHGIDTDVPMLKHALPTMLGFQAGAEDFAIISANTAGAYGGLQSSKVQVERQGGLPEIAVALKIMIHFTGVHTTYHIMARSRRCGLVRVGRFG